MKRKRAVLYVRVSRSTEESVSISRQEQELREVAEKANWPVVSVLADDGLSGRSEREKAEAALSMLAEGRAEVLMVWEMSRWSRMGLGAVAKMVDVLDSKPDTLFLAHKEGLRSDQPAFRLMASVIAEVARMEAEGTQARILSMRGHVLSETDSDAMRWLGGRTPFGYVAVDHPSGGRALELDPVEAPVVRELAERYLAGVSLAELTKWLQDENLATAQSEARRARQRGDDPGGLDHGQWRISTVRKLLLSPTLVGRMTRGDSVVTDAAGLPIQRWEPVVDLGTWSAIQARVKSRAPYESRKSSSWLSGYVWCNLCGSPLYINARKDRPDGSFRCSNRAVPGQSCPGVSISRPALEDYMESVVLGMVGDLLEYRVTERVEGAEPGAIEAVGQRLAEVQSALGQDGADYARLIPELDRLKERRRELLDAPGRVVREREATGRRLEDVWREGGVRDRQSVLAGMLRGIEVKRAERPRQPVEERVLEFWVDEEPE